MCGNGVSESEREELETSNYLCRRSSSLRSCSLDLPSSSHHPLSTHWCLSFIQNVRSSSFPLRSAPQTGMLHLSSPERCYFPTLFALPDLYRRPNFVLIPAYHRASASTPRKRPRASLPWLPSTPPLVSPVSLSVSTATTRPPLRPRLLSTAPRSSRVVTKDGLT